MADKVVVTNESALKAKYKASGVAAIKAALQTLSAADRQRGLKTVYVPMDSASAMAKMKSKPVKDTSDPEQNKIAIDAIFKKLAPDYLVILGAPDVVPHQDLKNPMYSPNNDDDKLAPGDIPYACEETYSRNPEKFVGPARVVGRIPDLAGATDPKYLIDLIEIAAGYTQREPEDYSKYLGLTAAVWKASTALSLQHTFGSSADLQIVPPKTDKWPKPLISRRAHFINCHGAESDFHFYGQSGNKYPESLDASLMKGQIAEGTVIAAECCYGAELYDPKNTDQQAGISSTYLREKAYGFFGSTTIAYGPAKGNGAADLICQSFLRKILAGASLGRAALEARQEFAQSSPHISPTDLKTLAQFNLLGDPSIAPVAVPTPHAEFAVNGKKAASAEAGHIAERGGRRRQLMARGLWLAANRPVARRKGRVKPKAALANQLMDLAKQAKIDNPAVLSFSVRTPAAERKSLPKAMLAKAPEPDAFHVVIGKTQVKDAPVPAIKALVANVSSGQIVSVQELYGKG
jgi:hypothetical protein